MANKIADYMKNIGKSIAYSAVDKFKETAPATSEFVETNQELFKEIVTTVRDFRTSYDSAKKAFSSSKLYESGDLLISSVFQDIKSGKFYNKERENKVQSDLVDTMMDDDEDYNFDEDLNPSQSKQSNVKSIIDKSSEYNAMAISNTVAKTGQYIVENNRTSTNILYSQNLQAYNMFGHHLNNLNQNISGLLRFDNEVMKVHAENSKRFFEEITVAQKTQVKLLSDILEAIKPSDRFKKDMEKRRNNQDRVSYRDLMGAEGTPDIKGYFNYVKKNIKNEFGTLIPNPTGDENTNILTAFVASPLKFIPQYIVNKAVPKALDESMKRLDKSISGFFGSLVSKINVMSNGPDSNMLTQTLGRIFGVEPGVKSSIDTSKYEKGRVPWTGKSQKALQEVIPTQLSKIISLLSGKDEERFDYNSGKFIKFGSIKANMKNTMNSFVNNATSDMREQFMKYSAFLTFQSAEDKKNYEKDMRNFFQALYKRGGFFDINNKDINSQYYEYGVQNPRNFRMFREMFKNSEKYMQQQINSKILSQRSAQSSYMRGLEEEGTSIYSQLNNNSNPAVYKKESGKIVNPMDRLQLKNMVDSKGHNLFDYLQNIYKELTFMRRSVYGGGNLTTSSENVLNSNIKPIDNKGLKFEDIKIPESKERLNEIHRRANRYRTEDARNERENKRIKSNSSRDNMAVLNVDDYDQDNIGKQLSYMIRRNNLQEKIRTDKAAKNAKGKSLIEELLDSGTISGKGQVLIEKINELSKKPIEFLSNTLNKVDERLYDIIYGKEQKNGDLDPKGFLNMLIWKTENTFSRVNTWVDENILTPIKDKLNIKNMKDLGKQVLGVFGIDADELGHSVHTYLFGDKKTGEKGLFTSTIDATKDAFKGAFGTVKGAFSDTFGPTIAKVKSSMKTKDTNTLDQMMNKINNDINNKSVKGAIEKNIVPTKSKNEREQQQDMYNKLFSSKESWDQYFNAFYPKENKKKPTTKEYMQQIYEKYSSLDNDGFFDSPGGKDTEEYYMYQQAKRYMQMKRDNKKKSPKIIQNESQTTSKVKNDNVTKIEEAVSSKEGFLSRIQKDVASIKDMISRLLGGSNNISSTKSGILTPYDKGIVKASGETGLLNNFSAGLNKVIMNYLTKNIHPHAEGTDEIKQPELATLSKGEKVVKSNGSLKDTLNTISSKGQKLGESVLDELSNKLNSVYSKEGRAGIQDRLKDIDIKNILLKLDPSARKKVTDRIKSVGKKIQGNKTVSEGESVIVDAARETYNAAIKAKGVLFGEPKDDSKKFGEAVNDVAGNISRYAPKAIGTGLVGAGVSLVTGAIGGPLLGAAVGAGISLAKSSDKVKDWLFGSIGKDNKRQGGVVSKETQGVLKKFLPDMKNLGIVGGVAGLTPFLPFGPIAGLMLGAGAGFLKNTSVVQERMFGKQGVLNKNKQNAIKKMAPRALAGMIPSLFLGPFGLLGNAAVGASLGLLSNTKGFNNAVFGTYNLATKQNENGLLPMVRDTMVNPIKKFYNKMANTLFDWVQEKIMKPVESAIAPISTQLELILKGIFTGIGKHIDNMFEKSIGIPLSRLVEDKIVKPVTNIFGKLFNVVMKPVKAVISSPFKLIGALGTSLRKSQIRSGNAKYMTAEERNEYRENNDVRSLGQKGLDLLGMGGFTRERKQTQNYATFDKLLASLDTNEIDKAYGGINTIRDSRKAAEQKRRDLRDEMGNQVSGYLKNPKLYNNAMKSILSGDMDNARNMISMKRANEKKSDAQVINKLNSFVENGEGSINKSKLIDYINKRIEDPKVAKQMFSLVSQKKYDKLLALINSEEKKKDLAEKTMINFINTKAKTYTQLANQKESQADLESSAYEQLSSLGITGINKDNADKYLDLLKKEKQARDAKTVKVAGAEGNESVTIDKGIKELTDQEKEQHKDIMDVISKMLNALTDIKKSTVENNITKYNKSAEESTLDANLGNRKYRRNSKKNEKARSQMEVYGDAKTIFDREKKENEELKRQGISISQLATQKAAGGVVEKTGLGTVSKGEYVYTPENTNKIMNSLPDLLQQEVDKKSTEETIVDKITNIENKVSSIDVSSKIQAEELEKPATKIDDYGNIIKFKKTKNGDMEPDLSDNSTKAALSKAKEDDDTQKGILSKLGSVFSVFSNKKKKGEADEEDKKNKQSFLGKLLTGLADSGFLKKIAVGLGFTALIGILGKHFGLPSDSDPTKTKSEVAKEKIDEVWNKDIRPWLNNTALPFFTDKVVPAIGDGIRYALTDGMPYIVKGVVSGMQFAITKMYPALLKAVAGELGMSGEYGEESFGGNVAYTVGRNILTNGGKNVENFAEKYATEPLKDIPKASDFMSSPLKSARKMAGGITKAGAKLGTKGISKIASIISTPVVGVEKALDRTKLFGKLPSLNELGKGVEEKGLNATIALSEAVKGKHKITGVTDKAAEKAAEKAASNGLVKSLLDSFGNFLLKLLGSSPVVKLVGADGAEKLTTKFIPRFLEGVSKQIEKQGTKLTGKMVASISTAGIANVLFAATGFVSGFNNSRSILGIIDEPTFSEKIVTGLIESISSGFIITSLIPSKILVNLAMDIILPLFGESTTTLQKQRDKARKTVEAYNKKYGTHYDVEQYNKQVQGDKSLWSKFKDSAKNTFTWAKNGIANNAKWAGNAIGKKFTQAKNWIGNNGQYVANQTGKAINFVKKNGLVGTGEYIGQGISDTIGSMFDSMGKKIEPIITATKDLLGYQGQLNSTGISSAWNLSLQQYMQAPQDKGTFSGFKKFMFYSNRILGAPIYGTVALGKGIYNGASWLINKFKEFGSYTMGLGSSGIDTAWNLDWNGYWVSPQEQGSPVSGFKKFMFYSNRILGAPIYSVVALGGAVWKGVSGVIDAGRNFFTAVSKDNDTIQSNIDNASDDYWKLPKTSGGIFGGFQKVLYGINRVIHAPIYYIHKLFKSLSISNIKDWFKEKFGGNDSSSSSSSNTSNSSNSNSNKSNSKSDKSKNSSSNTKSKTFVDNAKDFAGNIVKDAKSGITKVKDWIAGKGGEGDIYLTPSQYKLLTTNPKYIQNPDLIKNVKGFNPNRTNNNNSMFIKAKKAGIAIGGGLGVKPGLTTYIPPVSKNFGSMNRFYNKPQVIKGNSSRGIGGSDMSQFQIGTQPINSNVEAFRPTIDEYKSQYGVNDTDLVLAIIMQEAGGSPHALATDPMQSSESLGKKAGSLNSPAESIKAGLKLLGENLSRSGGDIPISLQAYNFGGGFIDYVQSHGGVWTQSVVDSFRAAHGGAYGDRNYVQNVLRYYHGDGTNVGNGMSGSGESKPTLSTMMSDFDNLLTHAQNRFFGFDDSTSSDTSGGGTNDGSVDANSATPATDYFKKTMGAQLTSPYGPRSSGFHQGIDMGAPAGTKVTSPIAGVVAANQGENESGGFGNVVYVKDKKGNYSIFGHLAQRSPLAVGQTVKQGTVIGNEGSTGRSSGPHLHYEVRKGSMAPGNSVDPNKYIKEYYASGGQNVSEAVKATLNAIIHPEGKDNPVPVKSNTGLTTTDKNKTLNDMNKKGIGGQSTTTYYSSGGTIEKLIGTIVTILSTIADNTANLTKIVQLLSAGNSNVSKQDLAKLDTTSGQEQVANALKKNFLTDDKGQMDTQSIIQTLNNIITE